MLYLDDKITISMTFPSIPKDGTYIYKVMKNATNVIFVGNVFLTKGVLSYVFELNELLNDFQFVNDNPSLNMQTDILAQYNIVLSVGSNSYTSSNIDVCHIYRYPHATPVMNTYVYPINTQPPVSILMLQGFQQKLQEAVLYPRIPFVQSDEFKWGILFELGSDKFDDIDNINFAYESDNQLVFLDYALEAYEFMFSSAPSVSDIYNGVNEPDDNSPLFVTNGTNQNNMIKVAEFDRCPAPYYLLWQDRFGGWQSQPFTGTSTYSESFDRRTTTKYDMTNKLSGVKCTPKWKINSQYIPFRLVPYYESIFVSPFLKLYDADQDRMFDVIIESDDFTEATFKNQGKDKLFNLSLDLTVTKPQNMIY